MINTEAIRCRERLSFLAVNSVSGLKPGKLLQITPKKLPNKSLAPCDTEHSHIPGEEMKAVRTIHLLEKVDGQST